MFQVNVPELRGRMAVKGVNMSKLSDEMKISRNTLTHYFNHPECITYRTMNQIVSTLQLTQSEASQIFLNLNLRKRKIIHKQDRKTDG